MLGGSEFTEEAVELHVDDFALAIVHYQVAVALPKAGFGEDGGAEGFTLIRANCVEKTMHFARYRNKSAIVMVLLAMSEYPFRERP